MNSDAKAVLGTQERTMHAEMGPIRATKLLTFRRERGRSKVGARLKSSGEEAAGVPEPRVKFPSKRLGRNGRICKECT